MRVRHRMIWMVCGCGLLAWATTHSWGDEAGESNVGLSGLIASYAPDSLNDDYFAELTDSVGDSWKEWTRETGVFVKDFYEGDHKTVQSQRESLQRLNAKLNTMKKALADPRYRSISGQISELYGRLKPRVEIAEAMLDTLTLDPEKSHQKRLESSYQQLTSSINAIKKDIGSYRGSDAWYKWLRINELAQAKAGDAASLELITQIKTKLENREKYDPATRDFTTRETFLALEDVLGTIQTVSNQPAILDQGAIREVFTGLIETLDSYADQPSGELETKIRQHLRDLRKVAPDGGERLAQSLGANYLNYNLRVFLSEGLINRFYQEYRQETRGISEPVMEAYVTGCQTSDVTARLDLLPSSRDARFAVTLSGLVRTNTNGYTHQATIHTVGQHTFSARQQVTFDGHQFFVERPEVYVNANNQTVGASTKFSGIPILGRIANNIAMSEATSRTPQANAIAAGKITQEVRGQLERETRQQFANASKDLETQTYGPLRKYDLYPDAMSLSSTDQEIRLWARLMGDDEVGGSQPAPVSRIPSNGLVAQVHESLLSNSMDRMGLAGKTMTDAEVRALLEERFSEILGREVKFETSNEEVDPEAQQNVLVFDSHDPVRFTVDQGTITIYIRAGLKRDNGEDIPTQVISVPFTPVVQGKEILLKRGNVGVRPVSRPPSVAAQVTRAQIMRQKIQSSLPERSIDGTMKVEQNGKITVLTVTGLSAHSGWLTVTLQ